MPAHEPEPDRIRYRECNEALAALGESGSLEESELYELLGNLRLAAESMHFDFYTFKTLEGLERAERVAPKVEDLLDRTVACLRNHVIRFVEPGGETRGAKDGVPLDAYQIIGEWISELESEKAKLLEPEDDDFDDL